MFGIACLMIADGRGVDEIEGLYADMPGWKEIIDGTCCLV